jgi:hypothetical protein
MGLLLLALPTNSYKSEDDTQQLISDSPHMFIYMPISDTHTLPAEYQAGSAFSIQL